MTLAISINSVQTKILHLNIASLSKYFGNLQSFLSLRILEHKINKSRKIPLVIHSALMKPKAPAEENIFFVSTNLTYKLQPDLLIIEPGSLDSTLIELIISKQKKI